MPRTNCPHCAVAVTFPPEMAGKTGRCPSCKGRFTIPAAGPDQPWYAEAVAQSLVPVAPQVVKGVEDIPEQSQAASEIPKVKTAVTQLPPVAQVALPPVAKAVEDIPYAEEAEPPRRRKKKEVDRPWYSVKVGGVLGGVGLVIAILVVAAILNKGGGAFGPSKSTVEAEALRVMNNNGVSVTSVDLIEEGKNKYVGIARGTSGEYKVNVTCDGDKIFVEYRPNIKWP